MGGALSGKTVLVTGASAGIGRASAIALAEAGAKVIATGRRKRELDSLAEQCGGGVTEAIGGDLNDAHFVDDLAKRAREVDVHFTRPLGEIVDEVRVVEVTADCFRDTSAALLRQRVEFALAAPGGNNLRARFRKRDRRRPADAGARPGHKYCFAGQRPAHFLHLFLLWIITIHDATMGQSAEGEWPATCRRVLVRLPRMKTQERTGPPSIAEHRHWRRGFERPHDQHRVR